jgi:undecaprenyl-diphosphatase
LYKLIKKIHKHDVAILRIINNSMSCKVLDFIMTPITYLGSTIFSVLFTLIAIVSPNKTIHSLGIKVLFTLSVSSFISKIIKESVNRIRPFLKISGLNIKKIGIDEYSFPSGHTTAAFSMAVTTSLFYPNVAAAVIFLASCVGISRIYIGVHYPTDVLAGTFIGSATSYIIFHII